MTGEADFGRGEDFGLFVDKRLRQSFPENDESFIQRCLEQDIGIGLPPPTKIKLAQALKEIRTIYKQDSAIYLTNRALSCRCSPYEYVDNKLPRVIDRINRATVHAAYVLTEREVGDQEVLARLWLYLQRDVRPIARRFERRAWQLNRMSVDDLCQECWPKFLTLVAQYDPKRGALWPLVEVSLRRHFISKIRYTNRPDFSTLASEFDVPDDWNQAVDLELVREEDVRVVNQVCEQLVEEEKVSRKDMIVFRLRAFCGKTFQAIADLLCREGDKKSTLHKAWSRTLEPVKIRLVQDHPEFRL